MARRLSGDGVNAILSGASMSALRELAETSLRFRESQGQTFKNRDRALNDAENSARKAIVDAIVKSLDEAERG